LLTVLAFTSVLIDAELVGGIKMASILFLWTAPAWLAIYLLSNATANRPEVSSI